MNAEKDIVYLDRIRSSGKLGLVKTENSGRKEDEAVVSGKGKKAS